MPVPIDGVGLTHKQRIFCNTYLENQNATRAAIYAGYSKSSARAIASENLAKPAIKKYMEAKLKEAIEKAGVGIDWRLELVKKTAEAAFNGQTTKDGLVDVDGVDKMISQVNKMSGDYAATNSNVKIETSELTEATEEAKTAEQEINEIKSY